MDIVKFFQGIGWTGSQTIAAWSGVIVNAAIVAVALFQLKFPSTRKLKLSTYVGFSDTFAHITLTIVNMSPSINLILNVCSMKIGLRGKLNLPLFDNKNFGFSHSTFPKELMPNNYATFAFDEFAFKQTLISAKHSSPDIGKKKVYFKVRDQFGKAYEVGTGLTVNKYISSLPDQKKENENGAPL